MRITHYMSRFRLADGGVVRSVLDFCSVLASRGQHVSVLTWDDTDIPAEWKTERAGLPRVIRLHPPTRLRARFRAPDAAMIERTLRESDVLHLHTPWDRSNLPVAAEARAIGLPYLLTVHGMLDDYSMAQKGAKKRVYLALAGRALLENAAAVHCTAQGELDQASKWLPRGRGCVIPYIFDLEPFRALPGPDHARQTIEAARTDDPIVLYLSRLHYKKQPEVLIDAARILRGRGVRFRALFAGAGEPSYENALRQRVRSNGLDGIVHFLGLVVGDQKLSLYQLADVFCLPTNQENFGFVFTESLACETPVIATKGTDIWQELEACGGAVIAEGRPEPIADAIADLLADRERARSMGQRGREWVFEALNPDTVAARFEEIYNEAIARHH